jgi:branched-chain amino acid transport system substrate-binding protein
MNNKFLTLIMALCFVSAALAGCTSNDADDDDNDDTVTTTSVKIGFLNPLTGPLAQDAAGFTYGATEAITDLNAMQSDVTFELVEADSGCDGTVGAAAAQTVLDANVVAVAGAACSGASMAANAVLSAAGVPMISYASTNPGLSDASAYPNFYRVVPSDAIQGPAAAAMMVSAGVEELAILHMTNDYGSGFADAIEGAWEGDLCAKIGYAETATDLTSEISQIASAGCDAVFMVSYVTDAALIINEVSAQDLDVMLFSGDGPAGEGLLEELTDDAAADGLAVTAPAAGTSYGDFEARYDSSGVGSIKQYVLTAYDAVSIIGKAYVADSTDMDASIRSVGTGYEGASGLHTFLANGDVGGAGYDICFYSADAAADGEYGCHGSWTALDGVSYDWGDEGTNVKLGFMNPITGPLAQDAAGFTYGAEQGIADLNAMGGFWGYSFELVEVDSGCDGTAASAAAQTLVDSGVWASGGAACSGASMAANSVLSAAGVPMISYASTNPGLSNASAYPDFFRIVPSDAIQGPAAADMMAAMGVANPAVIHMTNDYGSGFADAIEGAWDGDLCQKIGYAETQTSFASEITQIANAGCDAVFMVSYVTDAALILDEISTQGLNISLFSGDGPAGLGLLEELSDDMAADGLYVTSPRAGTSFGDFEARYDASGVGSIKAYVLTSYDSIMMLGEAAAICTMMADEDMTLTPSECIAMVGDEYEGASGLHTFLENGDVGGAGYDICGYAATTTDDGAYTCTKYWTVEDGVQDA